MDTESYSIVDSTVMKMSSKTWRVKMRAAPSVDSTAASNQSAWLMTMTHASHITSSRRKRNAPDSSRAPLAKFVRAGFAGGE